MKRMMGTAMGVVLAVQACWGAFIQPTQEQLRAAAEKPALVVPLVKDASMEEASVVGKDIIIEILKLDLKPEERDQRIAELLASLFGAVPPESHVALAIAMGKTIAGSPAASLSPEVVSAIQRGIILAADIAEGNVFGNAYNLSMQTVAGSPSGGKTVPPQPIPPPVALPYEVQLLD